MPAPDLIAVKAYLGDSSSYSDGEVSNALAAEQAAQAAVCKVPDTWPANLAEALKRRVARNLYMKSLPSGLETAASEAGVATVRVGSDPEIRRLEAPHRKRVVG
jgi:hypothetical protein